MQVVIEEMTACFFAYFLLFDNTQKTLCPYPAINHYTREVEYLEMKHIFLRMFTLIAVVVLVATTIMPVLSVQAQNTVTITITETEINDYILPARYRRWVSSWNVDLQPGQAVVTAQLIYARKTYDTVSTWTPSVVNGRLEWTLVSGTSNGTPLTPEQVTLINNSARRALRDAVELYIRNKVRGTYTITSVTVSDSEITTVGTVSK
ncbi:MAG: hypothetical protein OHK0023_12650 [Anaerolineae bacterium]